MENSKIAWTHCSTRGLGARKSLAAATIAMRSAFDGKKRKRYS
jgi:hypothetical protein